MKHGVAKLVFLVLLAASFIWITCSSNKSVDLDYVAKESFSFRVDVVDHSRLRLEGVSGTITITGEPESDSVLITGERRVVSESMQDAEAHLPLLQVSVQEIGNEIYVKTTQPEQTHSRSYVVDYTITVPEGFVVSVNHVTGIVSISSVKNSVSVNHVTGEVLLAQISGSAVVNLVTGEIEAEVTLPEDGTIN
ncbi:MAG: hypothetical protein WBC47_04880, partial [Dehalococcoidia bacterium]